MNNTPDIRLAVIDDHPIVVAGLESLLSGSERIKLASSAASGDEFLSNWSGDYDIILLDLNIPGESYRDNLESLKKKVGNAKIVAYTSYNSPALVRETLKLGCDGYILKQIKKDELLKGLQAVMDGERYVSTELTLSRGARTRRKPDNSELKDDFQKRLLLSKREKEILNYISKGYTSQHIADELFISRYTVETHRKNILRKLNFNTSTELVRFAVTQGLV